ncbi:DUF2946 family protein [Pseudomonas sp. MYb185]|uniref:DUF2946 family protein n=1 Tax=Pseudomonas sp. MYb185 TaxID=1848729 RepID=UPI000CFDD1DF|nr:DUF2946 family protein [Pseudomonas sp. MYb185]PRB79900.1 hypothetical protein CQ007_14970 [Pseudomonas sp. MYb185]
MTLARKERALLAWVLLLSILFSALHCAVGHEQVSATPAVAAEHDHHHHHSGHDEAAAAHAHSSADSGCDFASPFGAIILAAFFGLLGRLAVEQSRPLPVLHLPRLVRARWPPANPRASPILLPAL